MQYAVFPLAFVTFGFFIKIITSNIKRLVEFTIWPQNLFQYNKMNIASYCKKEKNSN